MAEEPRENHNEKNCQAGPTFLLLGIVRLILFVVGLYNARHPNNNDCLLACEDKVDV